MIAYQYNFTVQRTITAPLTQFRVKVNGTPLDLTGAFVLCQFRTAIGKPVVLEWTSTNGKIAINDAADGQFQFVEQAVDIAPGNYGYDITIILATPTKPVNYVYGTMSVQGVFSPAPTI